MAQAGYTPISLYYSTTAAAAPTAGNLVAGELALNTQDEKLYFKNAAGTVKLLASSSGASGDVVGPASATDNAIPTYDGTTGKLIKNNSGVTISSGVITATGFSGPLNGTVGATTPNTGAFTTLSASGVATFSAGSAAAPAITTSGDTNNGIFFPAADVTAITTAGSERMRIDSSGNVGIGTTSLTGYNLRIVKNSTGATTTYGVTSEQTIQSDVTSSGNGFYTDISTQNASFTLSAIHHFRAAQGTFGASSTVTNQYCFFAPGGAIGATTNYGFYAGNSAAVGSGKTAYGFRSDINIATGGGTTYNFFANGTAENYFAGNVGIGAVAGSATGQLRIAGNGSGATTFNGITLETSIQSGVTSSWRGLLVRPTTQATAFTLSNLYGVYVNPQTFGAGSTVTNQFGFHAESTLTGATNNYGFYSNIASGTGRWNFYANGTADNYFAGNVGIGTSSPGVALDILSGTPQIKLVGTGTTSEVRINSAFGAANLGSIGTVGASPFMLFTNNTERMRIDSSGNVGIGTSSPTVPLMVANSGGSTPIIAARPINTVSSGCIIGFQLYNASNAYVTYGSITSAITTNTAGSHAGDLLFNTATAGGLNERMRIDSSGNVGIGASSITNWGGYRTLQIGTSDSVLGHLALYNSTGRAAFVAGNTASAAFGSGINIPVVFEVNSSERMRITSAGDVGIGTTSPASKLDVNGTIRDSIGNVRSIIQNAQTTGYTLVATDNGKHISITTGGVTVPASIFSAGDVVTIFNNSGSNQTITQGASVTLRFAGTATTGNRTLAQYGVCTVLCVASNTFVISGAGLT